MRAERAVKTDELVRECVRLHLSGLTLSAIGKKLSVSDCAIRRWLISMEGTPGFEDFVYTPHQRFFCYGQYRQYSKSDKSDRCDELENVEKTAKWERRTMSVKPFSALWGRADKKTGVLSYIYITNENLNTLTESQRRNLFARNVIMTDSENALIYGGKTLVLVSDEDDADYADYADDDDDYEDDDILYYYENYRSYYADNEEEL